MEDVGLEALDLLRARDVAALLKVSERQAWRLIHSGAIDSLKSGQSVRVERSALAAYIKKCRDESAAAQQEAS